MRMLSPFGISKPERSYKLQVNPGDWDLLVVVLHLEIPTVSQNV